MIIEKVTTGDIDKYYFSSFPDQFKTEKYKTTNQDYIKQTMDFFANATYIQYKHNTETFAKNYNLLKGVMERADYFDDGEVKDFIDTLTKELKLPKYMKHYPILNPPINEMIGGLAKRKDTHRAKALDSNSLSQESEAKTQTMWQIIMETAKMQLLSQMQQSGQLQEAQNNKDPQAQQQFQQQFQQELENKVQQYIIDYTSEAEKWANHVMEAMKTELNIKELAEEMLRDFLICSRMYVLISEDNSKRGLCIEEINPRNIKIFSTPDKKYTKDSYAISMVNVMEISEIIEKFPDITKDEIDHLRESYQNGIWNGANVPTNYGTTRTGTQTIDDYYMYSPLLEQEREILAAELGENGAPSNEDPLILYSQTQTNPAAFGYKYVVTRSWWWSKILLKKIEFIDEDGNEQTIVVDENFKATDIPKENLISITEGWANIPYYGYKIGNDVYNIQPFKLLPYLPVIGGTFESKNSEVKSLLDLMKPFQVLYNIVVNQLYKLLAKDKGKVIKVQMKRIPIAKDMDPEDAIDMWEQEARERGIIFEDDTPETMKMLGNTNITQALDLDLSQQIQTRINLAQELKLECWELVGFTRQRLATPSPNETATANQNALNISYTQTEPYYMQHRYVMNQLYQAIVDAAKYVESQKPQSTISYLNDRGENAFIEVSADVISTTDIGVYVTSSAEDDRIFTELQSLSQAVLQNDGDLDDIVTLYTTNSVRTLKRVFKSLKQKKEALQQYQMQQQQDQIKAQQQEAALKIQQAEQEANQQRAFEAYQNELDRINKKEIALIQQYGRNPNALQDNNNNGIADALEVTKEDNKVAQANKQYNTQLQQLSINQKANQDKLMIELEKIALEREKLKTQFNIEKMKLYNPTSGETASQTRKAVKSAKPKK